MLKYQNAQELSIIRTHPAPGVGTNPFNLCLQKSAIIFSMLYLLSQASSGCKQQKLVQENNLSKEYRVQSQWNQTQKLLVWKMTPT